MSKSKKTMTVNEALRRKVLYISPALQRSIKDLIVPRIDMLEKMVSATQLKIVQRTVRRPSSDWWPSYSFKTHGSDKTDIRGVLVLTHNYLNGMPQELKLITDNLKEFVDDYNKRNDFERNDIETFKAYNLLQKMITDMYEFVINCTQHFLMLQQNRNRKFMKASEPNKIKERMELLIYDQYIYGEHQTNLQSLKRIIQSFCSLLGLA